MAFKNAKNYERKLRLALMGPPKSGKSFTALTIAHALAGENGKVAVIDTENASASKYAEMFPSFDVSELEQFNPDAYVREIHEAEHLGYDVLIIDSLTHAWNGPGGLLEYKDQLAKSGKQGMNSYTAWSEASPKHTNLIYAITHAKMHVIVTLRTKVEYVLEERKGKQVPVKIGLAPIQRDETEYEFDIMGTMDKQHTLTIDDSRCPALDNVSIPIPDGGVATTIRAWLAGEPMPEPSEQQKEMRTLLNELYATNPGVYARYANWEELALRKALNIPSGVLPKDYSDEQVEAMRVYVASKKPQEPVKASSMEGLYTGYLEDKGA